MRTDVYETTALAGQDTDKIRRQFDELLIRTEVYDGIFMESPVRQVKVISGKMDHILPFAHPLLHQKDHVNYAFIDGRTFTRVDPHNRGSLVISSTREYVFQIVRSALMLHAQDDYQAQGLKNMSPLPLDIFTKWVGQSVSRRLGLDASAQIYVAVMAGFLYLSQFEDTAQWHDRDREKVATQISRVTHVNPSTILDMTNDMPPLHSVAKFTQYTSAYEQNRRLEQLNPVTLFAIIGGTWYTRQGKEVACSALEHPPTWMAMIYLSIVERSIRDSMPAQIIKSQHRQEDMQRAYTQTIARIVSDLD